MVGVESHVLRYWEEQLDLPICRNEMGHRYYEGEDILLMQHIRQLMDKGVQLRAVKTVLPALLEHREDVLEELLGSVEEEPQEGSEGVEMAEIMLSDPSKELRMAQFQEIMTGLIGQALRRNNPELAATTTELLGEKVIKEMDYLMRVRDIQEEERYKKLDETIRSLQKTRKKLGSRKKKS